MFKNENDEWVDGPIHGWFGLSYSSYFTIPRMALQAMPLDWQQRFIVLMDEAEKLGLVTPTYHVLRDDPKYTLALKYDSEDETSRDHEFTILQKDPWANYRHPDQSLLPVINKLGRFGHHPDPAIDFCDEIDALEGILADIKAGVSEIAQTELDIRSWEAASFTVGGDLHCIKARQRLFELFPDARRNPMKE